MRDENEELRSENARLRGELQAYRILDAAGRINRKVKDDRNEKPKQNAQS